VLKKLAVVVTHGAAACAVELPEAVHSFMVRLGLPVFCWHGRSHVFNVLCHCETNHCMVVSFVFSLSSSTLRRF
jgi:hypothetical protein